MSKWYVIEPASSILPATKLLLIQEREGKVYEAFVEPLEGEAWKVSSPDLLFCLGSGIEKLDKFIEDHKDTIREVTEAEAFTIML